MPSAPKDLIWFGFGDYFFRSFTCRSLPYIVENSYSGKYCLFVRILRIIFILKMDNRDARRSSVSCYNFLFDKFLIFASPCNNDIRSMDNQISTLVQSHLFFIMLGQDNRSVTMWSLWILIYMVRMSHSIYVVTLNKSFVLVYWICYSKVFYIAKVAKF